MVPHARSPSSAHCIVAVCVALLRVRRSHHEDASAWIFPEIFDLYRASDFDSAPDHEIRRYVRNSPHPFLSGSVLIPVLNDGIDRFVIDQEGIVLIDKCDFAFSVNARFQNQLVLFFNLPGAHHTEESHESQAKADYAEDADNDYPAGPGRARKKRSSHNQQYDPCAEQGYAPDVTHLLTPCHCRVDELCARLSGHRHNKKASIQRTSPGFRAVFVFASIVCIRISETMPFTLMRFALSSSNIRRTLALCAAFFFIESAAAEGVLRVSAIPDEAPTELQRKFRPLGEYLSKETGMKVEFVPVTDYAAVVEALATGKLDMAWLGGFTFVQAKRRTNGTAIPIVQRAEDEKFISRFIVPVDSPLKSLADLKGKSFTFGSPSSTSGHLMPRYFLLKSGLNPEESFKNIAYSGAHDATVAFVAGGKADAGVLNGSVWDKLVESKNPNAQKCRVLATTPPYYDYNWTVRGGLDPAIVKKITAAFLKLDPKNPAHKSIMELQRASRFIPAKTSNYDSIESAAKSAGLLK